MCIDAMTGKFRVAIARRAAAYSRGTADSSPADVLPSDRLRLPRWVVVGFPPVTLEFRSIAMRQAVALPSPGSVRRRLSGSKSFVLAMRHVDSCVIWLGGRKGQ
jgi:hypothetical protein